MHTLVVSAGAAQAGFSLSSAGYGMEMAGEAGLPAPPGGGPSVGYRGGFVCLSDSSARWLFVRDMGLFGVGSSIGGGLCAGASNQFRAGLYFRSSVCGLACRFASCASAAKKKLRLRVKIQELVRHIG